MPLISRQQPLEIVDTLGSLLASIVDAQAQSARATIDFVTDAAFNETDDGQRRFRTTTVRYKKLDENQEEREFELEVPLLSLVNIPQLSVRTAKIDLTYDITETSETQGRKKIFGRIGKKSKQATSASSEGSVDMSLELTSEQLPSGLERLLDVLELAPREVRPDEE